MEITFLLFSFLPETNPFGLSKASFMAAHEPMDLAFDFAYALSLFLLLLMQTIFNEFTLNLFVH